MHYCVTKTSLIHARLLLFCLLRLDDPHVRGQEQPKRLNRRHRKPEVARKVSICHLPELEGRSGCATRICALVRTHTQRDVGGNGKLFRISCVCVFECAQGQALSRLSHYGDVNLPGRSRQSDSIEAAPVHVAHAVVTVGYLRFGPIEENIMFFVTSACARRTGAAARGAKAT